MDPSDVPYHAAQSRSLGIPMPPHPIAAEQARNIADMVLDIWDLSPLKDNTILVVSELVTNALKQRDVFWFALHRDADMALVEVTDTSPGNPKVKNASETDTHGRGLLLVDVISEQWGVRHERNGRKTVWAKIAK